MNILLTNDDGVDSVGLKCLAEALISLGCHNISVLAPDGDRSGISHSISLREPMRLTRRAENVWSCSGTPADCAMIALLGGLPVKPDFVLSGINLGPNIGTDIIYSGTAAAARQAALNGVPAAAISLASHHSKADWTAVASYVAARLDEWFSLWKPNIFLNINLPNDRIGAEAWVLSFPSRRRYRDKLATLNAPDGRQYCFIDGKGIDTDDESGSDWDVLRSGRVSLSPVYIHPVVYGDAPADINRLRPSAKS